MKKSKLGYLNPIYVLILMGGVYYMVMVNLIFLYEELFDAKAS